MHLMKLLKLCFSRISFDLKCSCLLASVIPAKIPYPTTFYVNDKALRTACLHSGCKGDHFQPRPLISAAWTKVWPCWSESGRQTWLSSKAWGAPSTPTTTPLWSARASSSLSSKTPGLPIVSGGKFSVSFLSMKCHVNDPHLVNGANRSSRMDLH